MYLPSAGFTAIFKVWSAPDDCASIRRYTAADKSRIAANLTASTPISLILRLIIEFPIIESSLEFEKHCGRCPRTTGHLETQGRIALIPVISQKSTNAG